MGTMGLHCIDIGTVEQILVSVRIISPHAINEFVLPHHVKNIAPRSDPMPDLPLSMRALPCTSPAVMTARTDKGLFAVVFGFSRRHKTFEAAQQVFFGHTVELYIAGRLAQRIAG